MILNVGKDWLISVKMLVDIYLDWIILTNYWLILTNYMLKMAKTKYAVVWDSVG